LYYHRDVIDNTCGLMLIFVNITKSHSVLTKYHHWNNN